MYLRRVTRGAVSLGAFLSGLDGFAANRQTINCPHGTTYVRLR